MSDVGYDGVTDVPDDVHASKPTCPVCRFEFDYGDDPDCGEDGCPVVLNTQTIRDLER